MYYVKNIFINYLFNKKLLVVKKRHLIAVVLLKVLLRADDWQDPDRGPYSL